MLKIQRAANGKVVFRLIGRLDVEKVAELNRLFASEPKGSHFVLDLKELTLVDREAVIYLAGCEADGIELKNCTEYIREWIRRERGGG